jgi:nitrate reductase NapAB chaperone NapD
MIPLAFMFLHCREDSEETILENVRSITGVAYAYKLDNLYDVVVKIESDSVEQFTLAIAAIRKVANILNTDTMVGFK